MKSLNDWLVYLQTLHSKSMDLNLDRVAKVAEYCHINLKNNFVITVAGTNGKGSCVAFLEAALINAGYIVGSTTSPHLICFNERIRINGKNAADDVICEAFSFIENNRKNISITYFEYAILAAALTFQQQQVDFAILEVGLGGRLDATNIFDPNLTLITNIALDHCQWLGDTREKIAVEKAGIMRKDIPICYGEKQIPDAIVDIAKKKSAPLFRLGQHYNYDVSKDEFLYQCPTFNKYYQLPKPLIHPDNAACCIMALNLLQQDFNISQDAIENAMAKARAEGRLQLIPAKKPILVDVSHNPHGAAFLAKYLKQNFKDKKIAAVFSMLKDKNILKTIEPLSTLFQKWYLAPLAEPRAATMEQLESAITNLNVSYTVTDSIEAAYEAALDDTDCDFIVAFGSFHVAESILRLHSNAQALKAMLDMSLDNVKSGKVYDIDDVMFEIQDLNNKKNQSGLRLTIPIY